MIEKQPYQVTHFVDFPDVRFLFLSYKKIIKI